MLKSKFKIEALTENLKVGRLHSFNVENLPPSSIDLSLIESVKTLLINS